MLSPALLCTLWLYVVAEGRDQGLRHVIPAFWDAAEDSRLALPSGVPVSVSAFLQASARLPKDFFKQLLYGVADELEKTPETQHWKGRQVFAVDGQKLNVGRWPELQAAFGVAEGAHCPQVLLSALVNVVTRTPIDYEVDSALHAGEREHYLRMLPSIPAGSLVILDRGYPSHEVIQETKAAGVDFLMRVSALNSFKAVTAFAESGEDETYARITPPAGSDATWTSMRVRLVRIQGPNGPAFFMTSLKRRDVAHGEIADLYHQRWESEEFFKLFTSEYAGQGQFRSRSELGIRHEIGALMLFLAMSRTLATLADEYVEEPDMFVSQKGAVLVMRRSLLAILLEQQLSRMLDAIRLALVRALRTLDERRPDRSFERRSFRPRLKWGPTGRVGA